MKVLYFTATWCGPCKGFKKTWEAVSNSDLREKMTFQMVDVDKEPELATQHNIRAVPTMVLLEGDKEVKRISGAMPEAMFKAWVTP